jgi:hypothetical protein
LPLADTERSQERRRPSSTRQGSANAWWRSLDSIPENHHDKDIDSGYSSETDERFLGPSTAIMDERDHKKVRLVLQLIALLGLAALLVVLAI